MTFYATDGQIINKEGQKMCKNLFEKFEEAA